ncbi:MAG TPA: hypothetical protein VGL62_07455 [Vicinamibacterales bacterium]|jgi:hypothetical protein
MGKGRAIALPAWIEDERSLLHYLMSKHDGHPYAEDVIDGVCLLTSWALIAVAVLSVLGIAVHAFI